MVGADQSKNALGETEESQPQQRRPAEIKSVGAIRLQPVLEEIGLSLLWPIAPVLKLHTEGNVAMDCLHRLRETLVPERDSKPGVPRDDPLPGLFESDRIEDLGKRSNHLNDVEPVAAIPHMTRPAGFLGGRERCRTFDVRRQRGPRYSGVPVGDHGVTSVSDESRERPAGG